MTTRIRRATVDDAPGLITLWRKASLKFSENEVADELAAVLARDPDIVLVAEDRHGLVGSVFCAYDGRRAWINRLATRPDRRGEGVATQLMQQVEAALVRKGCRKVNLLIEPTNSEVVTFYRRLGYSTDKLIFMEKFLSGPGS